MQAAQYRFLRVSSHPHEDLRDVNAAPMIGEERMWYLVVDNPPR